MIMRTHYTSPRAIRRLQFLPRQASNPPKAHSSRFALLQICPFFVVVWPLLRKRKTLWPVIDTDSRAKHVMLVLSELPGPKSRMSLMRV